MTRIALYQACTGIDPSANARALVAAVDEAAAGGAAILFTPEMSGLLDRDRERSGLQLDGRRGDAGASHGSPRTTAPERS